jgi:hypothetical protein
MRILNVKIHGKGTNDAEQGENAGEVPAPIR